MLKNARLRLGVFETIQIIHPLLYWRSHTNFQNNWKLATVLKICCDEACRQAPIVSKTPKLRNVLLRRSPYLFNPNSLFLAEPHTFSKHKRTISEVNSAFETIRISHPLLNWRSHTFFRNNWSLSTVSKKCRDEACRPFRKRVSRSTHFCQNIKEQFAK